MTRKKVQSTPPPRGGKRDPVIFVGDLGNENLKGVTIDDDVVLPHALIDLSVDQYEQIAEGTTQNPEAFIVNGKPYAIGKYARRKGAGAIRLGSDRYTEDYYGVLAAILLFNSFPTDTDNIYYFGSHAPRDYVYRSDLIDAVEGAWVVESCGIKKNFTIVEANCFGEPEGGYLHATLGSDGLSHRNTEKLRKGAVLVVDIGGLTTNLVAVEDGIIDYDSGQSHEHGIRDVLDEFEKLLKLQNAKDLKGWTPRPDRMRDALLTGKLVRGGGMPIVCKQAADESCNAYVADLVKYIDTFGSGIENFDAMLLTGGGSGLLEARIRKAFRDYDSIYIAEENRSYIHLANAYGGMKRALLLKQRGAF